MRVSVIIPTLNEADNLPRLLEQLAAQEGAELEAIVVDGGSSDATKPLARRYGALVIESQPGRGRQMNRGADLASAPWLLFLHADSSLTAKSQLADAVNAVERACDEQGDNRVAGHFRLRFERREPGHDLAYRYYEEKSALNRAECNNGDQGVLLSRRFFDQLGGFDDSLWFLEDQRMAERVRHTGGWITLPGVLATSARRFEKEGLARRMLLSAMIMNFHHQGLNDFFLRCAEVYRQQGHTGRLLMTPIFQVVEQLNREADLRTRFKRWLATGRYAQRHLWQPFFFADLLLQRRTGSRRHPLLAFHDHIFRPLTDFLPFHLLSAGVIRLGYLGCRLYFKWREG